MRKLEKHLYDGDSPFSLKVFQIAAFGGMLASFVGCFTSWLSGLPISVILITLFGGLAAAVLMFLAKKTGKIEICSCILVIILNMLVLPSAFFTSGGVRSGMSAWFVLGIFVVFLLVKGKLFWLILCASCGGAVSCYVVAYCYPELVIPLDSDLSSYEDMIFSILIVTLIIGLIVRFQNRAYEAEQQKIVEQNKELERLSNTKNRFFANMSHEIRTPINTIIGLNEMILREEVSEEITENAIHIQDASKINLC